MSQFFSNIYLLMLRPQTGFATLSSRASWWQAATLLWLISTLYVLSQARAWQVDLSGVFPVLLIIWGSAFFTWLGLSLILSLMADLFGGQGRITDTMSATGLAMLPFVFLPILHAFPNLLGSLGFSLQLLCFLGLFFWSLVLLTLGLTHSQQFSLDRAIGSLIISFFVLLALGFGTGILLVSQFILLLGQWL